MVYALENFIAGFSFHKSKIERHMHHVKEFVASPIGCCCGTKGLFVGLGAIARCEGIGKHFLCT